jgi:hypothetical protein
MIALNLDMPGQGWAHQLNRFCRHGLKDLSNAELMNRVDFKFLIPYAHFGFILQECSPGYSLLEINGSTLFSYKNTYFDTDTLSHYYMHHRGKLNRTKIRLRCYQDTGSSYLEVKLRSNKERTIKKRVLLPFEAEFSIQDHAEFLRKHWVSDPLSLLPTQHSSYQRVSLANNTRGERITFDLNYSVRNPLSKRHADLPGVVIAELKQSRLDSSSPFFKLLKSLSIHPTRFSKYCVGMTLTAPLLLKTNRFKPVIRNLYKCINSESHQL